MKPVNSDLREIRPITTPLQGDMFTMMKLVNSDIREIRLVTAPLQDVGEVLRRHLRQMDVLTDV